MLAKRRERIGIIDIDNSIESYREIVCENPYNEIWNQLYYFTDTNSVDVKIKERLDPSDGKKFKDDTKKQAQQISYSIMQADNYFRSAQEVDLSVKPNLIYYGMSSLANTVILYNNDGTFSLDYLRAKKKETHHGLDLRFSSEASKRSASTKEILGGISCEIHKRRGKPVCIMYKGTKTAYGHFKNFYSSITYECISYDVYISERGKGGLRGKRVVESANKKQIKELGKTNFTLLSMIRFLPDMIEQLADNEIKSNLYAGDLDHYIHMIKGDEDTETDTEKQQSYGITKFYISGGLGKEKEYFKNLYLQDKANLLKEEHTFNLHFVRDSRRESDVICLPDLIQDISGKVYFIYRVEEYVQELAHFYICFFCTGMLCRYYPDIWMRWLEENVGFRNLMDRLCSVATRKFPNLILNQLTQKVNHFHL